MAPCSFLPFLTSTTPNVYAYFKTSLVDLFTSWMTWPVAHTKDGSYHDGSVWKEMGSFKLGAMNQAGYVTFTVNHFNEPATYSLNGFLERNLDALNTDFVALLRGASTSASISAVSVGLGATEALEGAGSINPFVKGLFSVKLS